jgi:ABC-2 type transport system permease protein
LVINDLAVSFKNKSFFLIIFIPFFILVSLKLSDVSSPTFKKITIGILRHEIYPPAMMKGLSVAGKTLEVSLVSFDDGRRLVRQRKLDGLLLNNNNGHESVTLLVLKKDSFLTASIVELLSLLQKNTVSARESWISDIQPLQESGPLKQMLPVWILLSVLLVSCIIIPAHVAEDKEKNLLIGLLQTPMSEFEWLLAKMATGLVLINTAIVILSLSTGFVLLRNPGYLLFLEAGSLCFIACGVLLGFLCRTQAAARTFGILVYIPLLIPAALSDFSQKLNALAPFTPSYLLYNPMRSILLENARLSAFFPQGVCLLLLGTTAFMLSTILIKRRWLM